MKAVNKPHFPQPRPYVDPSSLLWAGDLICLNPQPPVEVILCQAWASTLRSSGGFHIPGGSQLKVLLTWACHAVRSSIHPTEKSRGRRQRSRLQPHRASSQKPALACLSCSHMALQGFAQPSQAQQTPCLNHMFMSKSIKQLLS